MNDRKGNGCFYCFKGSFEETSVHDDWDGVLHCTACNREVSRWQGDLLDQATGCMSTAKRLLIDAEQLHRQAQEKIAKANQLHVEFDKLMSSYRQERQAKHES